MRRWRKGEQGRIDRRGVARFATAVLITFILAAPQAGAQLRLYEEEIVQDGAADLGVYSYSVPSYVDWDNDGLKDLIVGEKTSIGQGKVRVYLNVGTTTEPAFNVYVYAQSGVSDLSCLGSGCMGCFPRVVNWDGDGKKDLLVGEALGNIKIFLNTNTDADPIFDTGTYLQVGTAEAKVNINVGYRATSLIVDWNNDGKKDLVAGAMDAKIHIFINEGTDNSPDFLTETFAQMDGGGDMIVLSDRSSPEVLDLDFDGKKDIVTGNTNGQLPFYKNTGTDASPVFADYELVEAAGVDIDLAGTPRSRPAVCDWTEDGYLDVLIGAYDGKVHLYQGVIAGDMDYDRDVDLSDFAVFADHWLEPDCGVCGGTELTHDGSVGLDDLQVFVANWLYGTE